jgi:hypothetical protein
MRRCSARAWNDPAFVRSGHRFASRAEFHVNAKAAMRVLEFFARQVNNDHIRNAA